LPLISERQGWGCGFCQLSALRVREINTANANQQGGQCNKGEHGQQPMTEAAGPAASRVNAPGAAFPDTVVGLVAGFIPMFPRARTVRKAVCSLLTHFLLESAQRFLTFL